MKEKLAPLSEDRIAYLDGLVRQGKTAAALFTQFTQQDVDRIVKAMVLAGLEQAQYLARLAIEETKLGVLEDKAIKNMVATEFVYDYVRDKRERWRDSRVSGARPDGSGGTGRPDLFDHARHQSDVHGAFQVHHGHQDAKRGDFRAPSEGLAVLPGGHTDHVRRSGEDMALRKASLPAWKSPTIPDNVYLMHHKEVKLIDATGGPGAVKAAYSSGKPALGVGAGNTPVYLEKTAQLDMAVVDIITSKTFDNGTICASEQTVVIDDEIYDSVIGKFAELGAHICDAEGDRAVGADGNRSGDRRHASHGRRPEGHRYRPRDRSACRTRYKAVDCAHSWAWGPTIRYPSRSSFRCSRCIARNPSKRRYVCAST